MAPYMVQPDQLRQPKVPRVVRGQPAAAITGLGGPIMGGPVTMHNYHLLAAILKFQIVF